MTFTGPKMFWASPKIWLHLVPLQKLLCWHKNQFYWMQIIFLSGTKCLWLPQYINKFLVWHKKFWPAQNILGPVKGHGISLCQIQVEDSFFVAFSGNINCNHIWFFFFLSDFRIWICDLLTWFNELQNCTSQIF